MNRRARTLDGLRLKARVSLRTASYHVPPKPGQTLIEQAMAVDGISNETAAAMALALDLLAMHGEAA